MRNIYIILIVTLIFLAGCGGGGDGTPAAQPTIARVTLSTQGSLPAGKALSGIDVTLQLPAGVTPALAANGDVDVSVVKPSGVLADKANPNVMTTYTPASTTALGTINFLLASNVAEGFGVGECATVTLKISSGAVNFATLNLNSSSPVASDLKVTSSSLHDLGGAPVTDLSVVFTSVAL